MLTRIKIFRTHRQELSQGSDLKTEHLFVASLKLDDLHLRALKKKETNQNRKRIRTRAERGKRTGIHVEHKAWTE